MAVRSGVLKFSGDAFSLADICDMIEWCSVNCLGPSLCVDCLNVCFLYFVYDFIIIIIIIIINTAVKKTILGYDVDLRRKPECSFL